MNTTLKAVMDQIRSISINAEIKTKSKMDLLESRISRAAYQPTLLKFGEKLMALMQCSPSGIKQDNLQAFLAACGREDASSVKSWLQEYSKTASMLCFLKKEEYEQAMGTIYVKNTTDDAGVALQQHPFDVDITIKCLSPLSHGGDIKMGNATIFRRTSVITDTGGVVDLPYYAGRAIRGQIRDLLADDFLTLLGFDTGCNSPQIANFFGHILYEGGCLASGGDAEKAMRPVVGNPDAIKTDFIRKWREHLPGLSALGCVVAGNRVLPGRFCISDFRPQCRQWGGNQLDVNDLFCWVFGTNRDDDESRAGESTSMIFDIECLRAGVILKGGIDFKRAASRLEISAVMRGLELMKKVGYIGAGPAVGHGRIEMLYNDYCPSEIYAEYIKAHKAEIIQFLNSFKGLIENDNDDGIGF